LLKQKLHKYVSRVLITLGCLFKKKIVLSDAVTFGRKEMEKIVQSWKKNLKRNVLGYP
jgi:hypothetical protein